MDSFLDSKEKKMAAAAVAAVVGVGTCVYLFTRTPQEAPVRVPSLPSTPSGQEEAEDTPKKDPKPAADPAPVAEPVAAPVAEPVPAPAQETPATPSIPKHYVFTYRDDSGWKKYDREVTAQLSRAGPDDTVIILDGRYKVDLKRMVQINTSSNFERDVRCVDTRTGKRTRPNLPEKKISMSGDYPPEVFARIKKCTDTLDLSGFGMAAVPDAVWELADLKSLNLCRNELSSIPSQIGKLRELREVYLNDNQLVSLPREIGQLPRLQRLYIHRNQLEFLPDLGSLKSLQIVWATYNQLTTVPSSLKSCPLLTQVAVTNNPLSGRIKEVAELPGASDGSMVAEAILAGNI